jgi:hypothetical protein
MPAGLALRGAALHTLQGASTMVRCQGATACTCFLCWPLPTATLTFRMSMARPSAVLGGVCAAAVVGAVRSAVRPWSLELASTAALGGLLRLWTAVVTGIRGLCAALVLQPVFRHGRGGRQRAVHGNTPPPARIKYRRHALILTAEAFTTDRLPVYRVVSLIFQGVRLHSIVAPPSALKQRPVSGCSVLSTASQMQWHQ